MDILKLRRVVTLTRGLSQMSSLASSDRQDLPSLSSHLLSGESKERCLAKLRRMKPIRPVNVSVKARAAVLGGSS